MSHKKCVINNKCILFLNLTAQSPKLNAKNELECWNYAVRKSANRFALN